MREKIVAGNWKLNGSWPLCVQFIQASSADAEQVVAENGVTAVLCPPATLISKLAEALSGSPWHVGGQNAAATEAGAFTGEISADMMKSAGATFCIIGHSERRALYHESDAIVAEKLRRVIDSGLRPILCVGEDLSCREAGDEEAFVTAQLKASTAGLSAEQLANLVVAYEPIWAIGTGQTATSAQAQKMHAVIRSELIQIANSEDHSILYGGSVKPENAEELLGQPDVDGALVGGASLKVADFLAIKAAG